MSLSYRPVVRARDHLSFISKHARPVDTRATRPTHYDDNTHGLSHEPTDLALGGPSPIGNIQPSGLAFDSGQATHYTERHSHDDTRPPTRQTNTAHIGLALPTSHATTPTQALPQRTKVKATSEAIIQLYPLHQLKPPPPVGGANALENWPLRAFGPPPAWVGGSTSIGASPCAFCADVIQSRGWRNPPPPLGLLAFETFWTNDGCGCRGESADGCWRTAAPPLSSGSKRAGCPSRVTHCRFSWS